MADPSLTIVRVVLFGSTVLIILLHAVEWFQIATLPRTRLGPNAASLKSSPKFLVLKGGLGVEMVYYFLLLVAFILLFPRNIVFLTFIAILGLFHLAAFQALLGRKAESSLKNLTSRGVKGFLIFDVVELAILVALAIQLYMAL